MYEQESRAGIKSFYENEKNKFAVIRLAARVSCRSLGEVRTLPLPMKLITHSLGALFITTFHTNSFAATHEQEKLSSYIVSHFAFSPASELSQSAFYEFKRCLYTSQRSYPITI